MKKITALILTVIILVSLAACEKSPATADGGKKKAEITFTETTVVDNEKCSVVITEIDPDGFWGYTLKVHLENKTEDINYTYVVENATINGVQEEPLFFAEVAPGKKANEEISFSLDESINDLIGDYTDIELTFRVYDGDWNTDDAANETVHVYPYGEDKATKYVRASLDTDNVLVDNEYATVIVTGYDENSFWGYDVNLFIENKSDKNLMVSVDNASINGIMADPFYAVAVLPGKCTFSSISWFSNTLEENDITDVETIEFELKIYDCDNLLEDYITDDVVKLNP